MTTLKTYKLVDFESGLLDSSIVLSKISEYIPFTPSDYDLDEFNNVSPDPFVRVSEVPSGGGGATNLSNTPTPTGIALGSSTGTGTTLPLADATNAGLLSPAEKTTISALPLIIADATPSALVTTSGVSTIVKTYNIGSLNGRKILKFNVRAVRTLTGANARITVSLRDTITNTVVTVNLAQTLNPARTIFNLRREIPLDQTAGVMRIMPFSTNTDDGEFTTPLTNQAINFTNPLELRVELLDSSASVSIQTYQTLIELI